MTFFSDQQISLNNGKYYVYIISFPNDLKMYLSQITVLKKGWLPTLKKSFIRILVCQNVFT